MADIVYEAELDLKKVFAQLNKLEKRLEGFEKTGTESFKKVQTQGSQRIRQLGFALQRFGIGGAAAFGEIFVAAGAAGLAIGGVLVVVNLLAKAFKALVNIAVTSLKTLIKSSVETARAFERVETTFVAVFEGGRKEAKATFDFIKKISLDLGQDISEVARTFLPEVANLDQLREVVEIATALSRAQPEQGIQGARIALQDALSGEFISLKKRFEFKPAIIAQIKEAFDEEGITGGLRAIQDELDRTGRDIGTLSDTFDVSLGRIKVAAQQTSGTLGGPIIDALKVQLDALFAFFLENKDELDDVARTIGDLFANLATTGGGALQDFVEGINLQDVLKVFVDLSDVAERLILAIKTLVEGFDTRSVADFTGEISDFAQEMHLSLVVIGDVFAILTFLLDVVKGLTSPLQAVVGLVGKFADATGATKAVLEGFSGAMAIIIGLMKTLEASLIAPVLLLEVFRGNMTLAEADAKLAAATLAAFRKEIDQHNAAVAEGTGAQIAGAAAAEEYSLANEAAANAIIARKFAEGELAKALSNITELEAEIEEKRGKFATDAASRLLKIEKDFLRDKLDLRIANGRRFLDIEIQLNEKFLDLQEQYNDRFRDLGIDLDRDREDAIRDEGRRRIEIEADLADKREDIERDHLRRLAEIRRRFDFDAQEAIRANDAIAFLRIKRRMEFDLNEARLQRDEEIITAEEGAEEKRQALDTKLQEEIEDAEIANRRKIEDLNTWLMDQTEIINLWAAREREASLMRLQRDREDRETEQRRQLEDYNTWWADRHTATEAGIATELRMLEDFRNKVSEIYRNWPQLNPMRGVLGATPSSPGGRSGRSGGTNATGPGGGQPNEVEPGGISPVTLEELRREARQLLILTGKTVQEAFAIVQPLSAFELADLIEELMAELQGMPGRKHGGPVKANQPVLVGEPLAGGKANPEIFVPGSSGFITPLSRFGSNLTDMMMMNPLLNISRAAGAGSTDNSRNITINQPQIETGLTAKQVSEIKELYLELRLEEDLI